MGLVDLFAYLLVTAKVILYGVAVIFFISGIDDLFIDLYYGIRALYRHFFILRKYSPLTEEQLLQHIEKPIAILVPAWDESKVIRRMLENNLRTLNYSNYQIFVGTYPNDPDTQTEVEIVREQYENLHRIVCPKDGPTNKADCLNWIYQGIRIFEEEHNQRFEIFVMEDAEDIIHPLALKLFNYLIPRKDMVQLAVLPLPPKWYNFTEGHYVDEFSENHYKNLVVREFLSHNVPSAGVGCAFSRRAIEVSASLSNNQLFSIDSLTEDYDIGLKLQPYHLKQIFVKQAIERRTFKKGPFGRKKHAVRVKEYIAIRGYFPKHFRAAVRQKSRWIVGICLQGWAHLGWPGSWANKYMLYRDRKALVNNYVNMLGYYVLLVVGLYWLSLRLLPDAYRFPPLVYPGSWIWYLIWADTVMMLVRIFERCFCVFRFYDLTQALLSIPRFLWGNVINFVAGSRALYLYAKYLVTGKLIPWDKTSHAFPSDSELKRYHRKLGDLLLDRRFLTVRQLDAALQRQKQDPRPLGAILLDMGLVQEEDLINVLGVQLSLSTREVDPYEVPLGLMTLVPREVAIEFGIFPVEINRAGRLVVTINEVLSRAQLQELEERLGRPVDLCLTTRQNLAFAIHRGYQRLEEAQRLGRERTYLGQKLLERGLITSAELNEALKVQRQSYTRFGDILLELNLMDAATLHKALNEYRHNGIMALRDFLVEQHYITPQQMQRATKVQAERFRRLGEVLVDLHFLTAKQLEEFLQTEDVAA
jgi:bacteriophage N4 adsorption protein B